MLITDLVVSLHKRHADNILAGTKKIELRRKAPTRTNLGIMYLYETSPTMMVVGYAHVGEIAKGLLGSFWDKWGDDAGLPRSEYDSYFEGCDTAFGITVFSAHRLNPVPITQLGLSRAPQSWGYIQRVPAI